MWHSDWKSWIKVTLVCGGGEGIWGAAEQHIMYWSVQKKEKKGKSVRHEKKLLILVKSCWLKSGRAGGLHQWKRPDKVRQEIYLKETTVIWCNALWCHLLNMYKPTEHILYHINWIHPRAPSRHETWYQPERNYAYPFFVHYFYLVAEKK